MVWPTPGIRFDLDRPRRLRLTFRAMRTFEDVTSKSLMAYGTWSTMQHEEVWVLLWVCLLAEEPTITLDYVGEYTGPGDLLYIMAKLHETVTSAMPEKAPGENTQSQSGESPDWLTLWTIGTVDLGLSDREFWDLTPREFGAKLDRRRQLDEIETENGDLRTGIVASVVFNMLRSEKEPARAPKDFMPDRGPAKTKEPQTGEHMLAVARILNAAYGGDVIET